MTTYKILVIDDAFFIRNLIKKAVVRKPLKNDITFEIIGEAQNGVEALELCKELNPDIITVDFNIPELNGLDFAKYLKETNPKIPILMISSNTDPSFPSQVEEIGCHFLQKPFQESFLWMRLDTLAKEIEEFDESKIKKEEVSEETLSILKEISMEVEAELEEDKIELEEMTLPKANQNNSNKSSKKKKKKKNNSNKNLLFGLEIDDSLVIKPSKVETTPIVSQPKDLIDSLVVDKIDLPTKKESIVRENNVDKKEESSIPKINLNQDKEGLEEKLVAVVDDEEIIIEEESEPIVIDEDEEDALIIVEDDDEIIIETDEDDVIQIDDDFDFDGDEEIIIFDLDDTKSNGEIVENVPQNKIGLNIKKKEEPKEDLSMLSEKELAIRRLKENVSYSYQTEMSYVLHVMEKIHKSKVEEELNKNNETIQIENPIQETVQKNILGITNMNLLQPEDLTKEEENQEFDKLFAEFNPHMDIDGMNAAIERDKAEREKQLELERKKLLESSPAISQKIVIEPPRSEKVKQLYSNTKIDEDFILPIEEQPKKESIFTKIFKFFSKSK